jgi:hypothetical protein
MTCGRKKSRFGRKRGISIKIDQTVEIPLQGVGLIAAINQRFIVNLKQKCFFSCIKFFSFVTNIEVYLIHQYKIHTN